jgi:hypothetical protein
MIVFSADSEVDACKILVCGGRVLPARHIDGPGDDGRATPLHDREYPKSSGRGPPPAGRRANHVKLVLAGVMAVFLWAELIRPYPKNEGLNMTTVSSLVATTIERGASELQRS